MRRIRVIPVMSIDKNRLVKTVKFSNPNYIGDPINSIKLFNDKQVDEIALLDITATKLNHPPNFSLIKEMAEECFIPLSYGGGITTLDQVKKLFDSGIEKVILNSVLEKNPQLIEQIAHIYGSQSVVASIDIKKSLFGHYTIYHQSGKKKSSLDINSFLKEIISLGVGEILLQNMERDGTFRGYDLDLIKYLSQRSSVPLVACGGTNSLTNMKDAILLGGASAVAGGSYFVYVKNNTQSILINYPSNEELKHQIFDYL